MQKCLLCVQLVRFLEKLVTHMLNKAAFDKQHATSWLASAAHCQLSDASCPDLCLLRSIVQSYTTEKCHRKDHICQHCLYTNPRLCLLGLASDSESVPGPCAYLAGGAGQQAAGATAYVTLEPCNHYGKTPPCSQALVDAKVAKVSLHTSTPSCDSELCSACLNYLITLLSWKFARSSFESAVKLQGCSQQIL